MEELLRVVVLAGMEGWDELVTGPVVMFVSMLSGIAVELEAALVVCQTTGQKNTSVVKFHC